jgi:hypothetical protein
LHLDQDVSLCQVTALHLDQDVSLCQVTALHLDQDVSLCQVTALHLDLCSLVCWQVYESCEALFASLADEAKKYSDWLVLGDVAGELEEHVEAVLCGDSSSSSSGGGSGSSAAGGDVGDWELNLRMLKTAAYDLNKLPNEVR